MQRLGAVSVALESCDGVGDEGVRGEVLERRGVVSYRTVSVFRELEGATYVQKLRVMGLFAVDRRFSHGCFLCVGHEVETEI